MPGATHKTILLVDDEPLLRKSLAQGLVQHDPQWRVLTAEDGGAARACLDQEPVDLVLTDLAMPGSDGFELLSHLAVNHPWISVLVMTAFGTPETTRRLHDLGFTDFLEKPLDLNVLIERVSQILDARTSGYVRGISLPTFLQILELDGKTCDLGVAAGGKQGTLYIVNGALHDAQTATLSGEAAAIEIVCWSGAEIAMSEASEPRQRRIAKPLRELMLESFRRRDESQAARSRRPGGSRRSSPQDTPSPSNHVVLNGKEIVVAIADRLKELAVVDGFLGAGLFTPAGESLGVVSSAGFNKEIGVLANNVLQNAQRASLEMGTGRGQQVHVEAEKAHIIVRCLNEGNDPLKSEPGKAHIHLVLALASDDAIGLAKMKVNSVIEKLATECRG